MNFSAFDYLINVYVDINESISEVNEYIQQTAHSLDAVVIRIVLTTQTLIGIKDHTFSTINWEVAVKEPKLILLINRITSLPYESIRCESYPCKDNEKKPPNQICWSNKNTQVTCDLISYPIPPLLFSYPQSTLSEKDKKYLALQDKKYLISAYCKQLATRILKGNEHIICPTTIVFLNSANVSMITLSLSNPRIQPCQNFVLTFFLCMHRLKILKFTVPKFLKIKILSYC